VCVCVCVCVCVYVCMRVCELSEYQSCVHVRPRCDTTDPGVGWEMEGVVDTSFEVVEPTSGAEQYMPS
jgi:hypothetical protein